MLDFGIDPKSLSSVFNYASGSVLFVDSNGIFNQDNANLYWDSVNHRLGIGTSSPTTSLDVNGVATFRNTVQAYTGTSLNLSAPSNQLVNLQLGSTSIFTIDGTGVNLPQQNTLSYSVTLSDTQIWAQSFFRIGNDLSLVGSLVAGSANQRVLMIESNIPVTNSLVSYTKAAFGTRIVTADPSVPGSITRDASALSTKAYTSGTITTGRIWGAYHEANVASGTDGLAYAEELTITNFGTDQAGVGTSTSKYGLHIVADGTSNVTSAVYVAVSGAGALFHRGFYMDITALGTNAGDAFLQFGAVAPRFQVDFNGVVTFNTNGILSGSGLTAARTFTFPDATTKLAGLAVANTFTQSQTITVTDANPLTINVDAMTSGRNTTLTGYANVVSVDTRRANGTLSAPTPITSGQIIAQNRAWGYDGSTFYNTATIQVIATENFVNTTNGGSKFTFQVTPNGSQSIATALVIDQDQTIKIGPTSRLTFSSNNLTAQRTFTFPDATAIVAGQNFANNFTTNQTITITNNNIVGSEALRIAYTLNSAGATAPDYAPLAVIQTYTATDPTNPFDLALLGIQSKITYGTNQVSPAVGTVQAFTSNILIQGSAQANNEFGGYMGWITATNSSIGDIWMTDYTVNTSVGTQMSLMTGATIAINNYYNGSPSKIAATGMAIVSNKGTGAGKATEHTNADTTTGTFPVDIGLFIGGKSGIVGGASLNSFTTAIQIGGAASGWMTSGTTSLIGTGINIRDMQSAGITFGEPASSTTPTAINFNNSTTNYTYGIDFSGGKFGTAAINYGTNNIAGTPTFTGVVTISVTNVLNPLVIINDQTTANAGIRLDVYANPGFLNIRRANGTKAAPTPITSGQTIGIFVTQGYDGSTFSSGPQINMIATENWSAIAHGSDIEFVTVANATTTQNTVAKFKQDGSFEFGSSNRNLLMNDSGLTAQRTFTFPDTTTKLAGLAATQTFTAVQTMTMTDTTGILNVNADAMTTFRNVVLITGYGNFTGISLRSANGTLAAPTATTTNQGLGRLTGRGYDGTTFADGAYIQFNALNNWSGTDHSATVAIVTTAGGTTSVAATAQFNGDGTFQFGASGNLRGKLSDSGLTAQRTFTFQDSTYQIAGVNIAQTFTAAQTITVTDTNAVLSINDDALTAERGIFMTHGYGGITNWLLRRADGTKASPTSIQNTETIGRIKWQGYDGGGFQDAVSIYSSATETWVNGTNRGSNLTIQLAGTGQASVASILIWNGPNPTLASAAGLTYNMIKDFATTITLTGTTTVTALQGVQHYFNKPTITDSSAVTVTNSSSAYFDGPPQAGGSVTLTNSRTIWVNSGVSYFGGAIEIGANSTNNQISTASQGSASTTMYIGNSSINVTASDAKLKQVFGSTKIDALSMLHTLPLVDFRWTDAATHYRDRSSTIWLGMVAQQLYQLPEWKHLVIKPDNLDNNWAIDYQFLVPYNTRAILQLNEKVQKLENENEELRRLISKN